MKRLYKKIILSVITAIALLLIPLVALADSWQYYIEITVTENSSTARTNLPLLLGISGQNLINAGYLNSNATNSQMTESTFNRTSGMATGNVSLFISSLLASQSRTYRLYTGFSPNQTSFPIIPGYGGNISVADAPNLELGSNFSASYSGFLDTTINSTFWNKSNAYSFNTSSNGSIIATFYGTTNTTSNLSPNGAGQYIQIPTVFGAATHWEATLTNDGNTSYVSQSTATAVKYDTYAMETVSTSGTVAYVRIFMVAARASGSGDSFAATVIGNTGNASINVGITNSMPVDGSYNTYNTTYITCPWTGKVWDSSSLAALEVGVQLWIADGNEVRATQVYAEVNYGGDVVLTANGIASGTPNITANTSSGNVSLYINSILKDTISLTQGITNNSNNTTLMGLSSPYASNITLSVNNTQVLWYQPNIIISGSVLPNRASSSNNGTINWGTNPAGLIITIGGIIGYNTVVPTTNVTSPPGVGTLKSPTGWIGTGAFAGVLTPELIQSFEDAAVGLGMPAGTGGIHYRGLMLMIMFGVAVAIGLSVLLFTGSVLITIFVVLGVLTFGSSTGVIDQSLVWITGILSLSTFYLVKQH